MVARKGAPVKRSKPVKPVEPAPPRFGYDDASHTYKIDGEKFTSVTTVLAGGVPKPRLPEWYARTVAEHVAENPERFVGMDPESIIRKLIAVPDKVRDSAAARGTRVHELAEQLAHGETVQLLAHEEPLLPWVEGYARFIEEWEITELFTEVPVFHEELKYAGRFDAVVSSPKLFAGEPFLLDRKTSTYVYRDTGLQCAAYVHATHRVDDFGDVQAMDISCAATVVAHIRPEGTTPFLLAASRKDIQTDFDTFQAALVVARRDKREVPAIESK